MPVFESRTPLSRSGPEIFEFLILPQNLQRISPPELQLVFTEAPPKIDLGSRLTVKVAAYGTVQQLSYEIVEFDPPQRFREVATSSPFQKWIHDYIVEPSGTGVVLVNRIEFEPPKGLLGMLLSASKIADELEDGFEHRRQALQGMFGNGVTG